MGEPLPETPTASARTLVLGLALGCAFRCVDKFGPSNYVDSIVSGLLAAGLTVVDYKLAPVLAWAGPRATVALNRIAANPAVWICLVFIFLIQGAFSPFIEQRRLPFSELETSPKIAQALTPQVDDLNQKLAQKSEDVSKLSAELAVATNSVSETQRALTQTQKELADARNAPAPIESLKLSSLAVSHLVESIAAIPHMEPRCMPMPSQRMRLPITGDTIELPAPVCPKSEWDSEWQVVISASADHQRLAGLIFALTEKALKTKVHRFELPDPLINSDAPKIQIFEDSAILLHGNDVLSSALTNALSQCFVAKATTEVNGSLDAYVKSHYPTNKLIWIEIGRGTVWNDNGEAWCSK